MGVSMNIPYEFQTASIFNIQEINSSFATGSLKVMYLGENRNGSFFSKEAVERALPSLRNVPIVCHWDDEAGEIGGHDITVVSDDNGNMRLKNLTEPCGVVPDHAVFSFAKEFDENGVEHEYLVIDGVILWKRQDVFRHIQQDLEGHVKHSMEITVRDLKKESENAPVGYIDILDFEFTALCLLENCEPCFQGSALDVYSANHFKEKMGQMLAELKSAMESVTTSFEVDNRHPQQLTEGGETVLDEKKELVEKYGIDIDALDFSIEDFTVEELKEKFEAMNAAANDAQTGDAPEEPEVPEVPEEPEDKFALTSNIVDEVCRVLGEVKIQNDWGEFCRYWYVDCDFELNEVYCWDTTDWLLYGFSYAVDGDSIKVDYESKKRMKYVIADFDEGDQASPFAPAFELLQKQIAENAEWEAKYHTASDMMASMEEELGTLRQFKSDTESAQMQEKRDEIFGRFDDLVGIEAFENLRENSADLALDVLEEKLYAIRGKYGITKKFTLESKAPKVKVEKKDTSNDPYGDLFEKYGPNND